MHRSCYLAQKLALPTLSPARSPTQSLNIAIEKKILDVYQKMYDRMQISLSLCVYISDVN